MLAGEALAAFKENYWHQQAFLFPQAVDIASYQIPKDHLLQLAAADIVESRLIQPDYGVEHGPLLLDDLPDTSMLMIQCLEYHSDKAQALLRQEFSFLPPWQVDDVMASIGSDGASCGPHFDRYDVFLLQLSGTKSWQLDNGGHREEDLRDDAELRLLDRFTPTASMQCEPGDVLYLPPGVGHHGICSSDAVTLSIGIRNPTMAELLAEISEFALLESEATVLENQLREPGAKVEAEGIASLLSDALTPRLIDTWYGSYVTRLRNPEVLEGYSSSEEGLACEFQADTTFVSARPTRLAWTDVDDETLLFVNGECYRLPYSDKAWIKAFCESRSVEVDPSNQGQSDVLHSLVATGAGHFI